MKNLEEMNTLLKAILKFCITNQLLKVNFVVSISTACLCYLLAYQQRVYVTAFNNTKHGSQMHIEPKLKKWLSYSTIEYQKP